MGDQSKLIALMILAAAGFGVWLQAKGQLVSILSTIFGTGSSTPGSNVSTSATATLGNTAGLNPGTLSSKIPASISQWQTEINNAAAQYGVPAALIAAIMQAESEGNPSATNHNSNGTTDYGLMQINQAPERGLTNPFDPTENINAGAQELAQDLKASGGSIQAAAGMYNAGIAGYSKNPLANLSYQLEVLRNYMMYLGTGI